MEGWVDDLLFHRRAVKAQTSQFICKVWPEPLLFVYSCSYTQNMVADEDSDQLLANTKNVIKMVTIKIVDKPLR